MGPPGVGRLCLPVSCATLAQGKLYNVRLTAISSRQPRCPSGGIHGLLTPVLSVLRAAQLEAPAKRSLWEGSWMWVSRTVIVPKPGLVTVLKPGPVIVLKPGLHRPHARIRGLATALSLL